MNQLFFFFDLNEILSTLAQCVSVCPGRGKRILAPYIGAHAFFSGPPCHCSSQIGRRSGTSSDDKSGACRKWPNQAASISVHNGTANAVITRSIHCPPVLTTGPLFAYILLTHYGAWQSNVVRASAYFGATFARGRARAPFVLEMT